MKSHSISKRDASVVSETAASAWEIVHNDRYNFEQGYLKAAVTDVGRHFCMFGRGDAAYSPQETSHDGVASTAPDERLLQDGLQKLHKPQRQAEQEAGSQLAQPGAAGQRNHARRVHQLQ